MHKKLTGKYFSIILTFVMVFSILSGCGASGNNSSGATKDDKGSAPTATPAVSSTAPAANDQSKNVELRFGWWGSQTRHDRTLKLIDKFHELHPNITIKPEYSSWGDIGTSWLLK